MEGERIAVVGLGAIGGAVAADLADLGRYDLLGCVREAFDELVVEHPSGLSRNALSLATRPEDVRPVPWVLLATKAYQCADAKPWLDVLCGPGTRVAVLQNGVDHVERVAPLLPAGAAVVPVVIQLAAEKTAPGRVTQDNDGWLIVPDDEAGRAFAALFEGARAKVEPRADFVSQKWWKLIGNAALGAVCALAVRPGNVANEPDVEALALGLMREVVAVGRADGAKLPDNAPERVLAGVRGAAPKHWPSIALDRREGRPLEWDVRNAVVGRIGRRHGVPTPLNDAVTALLRCADPRFEPTPGAAGEALRPARRGPESSSVAGT